MRFGLLCCSVAFTFLCVNGIAGAAPAQKLDVETAKARHEARVNATLAQFNSNTVRTARELGRQSEARQGQRDVASTVKPKRDAPPTAASQPTAPTAAPITQAPPETPPPPAEPTPPPSAPRRQRTDPWNNPYGVQYDDPALQGDFGRYEDPALGGEPNNRITGQGTSGPITGRGKSGPITGQGKSGPITGQGRSGPITGQGKSGPITGRGKSGPVTGRSSR